MKHLLRSKGDLYTSTYDILEKLTSVRNKIRVPMIIDSDGQSRITSSFLIISTSSFRSWDEISKEARWKISLNDFTITRLLKPYSSMVAKDTHHAIFIYDLTPITKILNNRNILEVIYAGSEDIYIDQITLATILDASQTNGSTTDIFIGPAILDSRSRISLDIEPDDKAKESTIKLFVSTPSNLGPSNIELKINDSNSYRVQFRAPIEYALKIASGDIKKISIENVSRTYIKINWMAIVKNRFQAPKYIIEDVAIDKLSDTELLVRIQNLGDLSPDKLHIVAIYRGSVIGRSTINNPKDKELVAKLPIKTSVKDSSIIVRVLWKWMGDSEYTQKEYRF